MEYVVGAAIFVGAVVVLFLLVRAMARGAFGRSRRLERDLGTQVLRERLARNEITQGQFDEAVRALGKG